MAAPALLLALALAAPADEAAWLARLPLPRLYRANLRLEATDRDLGLAGYDLGFPATPEEQIRDARDRMEAGERSAAVLHQASAALLGRDPENLRKLLPACLAAYRKELEERRDDLGLCVGFAKALCLAGSATRDDRFFRDSAEELERAAALAPEDWRIRSEHAAMLVTRALVGARAGHLDPAWLDASASMAEAALRAAPREPEVHWRLFHARYLGLVTGPQGDRDPFPDIAGHADAFAGGVAELEGAGRLQLCAEGFWFLACIPSRAVPEEELPSPAPDDVVRERVAAFRGRLAAADLPAGLRRDLARTWWTLYALAGPLEGWDGAFDEARGAGLEEQEALTLALMGLHRRGSAEAAAGVAARLAQSGTEDGAFRVLTVYRHETGDDAGALDALAQVLETDVPVRLARGILELRRGRTTEAVQHLTLLALEAKGTPEHGHVLHALGVARAMAGDLAGGSASLAQAAEALEEDAGVAATLAEVRARVEEGGGR